jgi:nicotinamidase-related amidase
MSTSLLIIDPQKDFTSPNGALYVEGAQKDMENTADLIYKHGHKIDNIYVTVDSHHCDDIAHPYFWKDADGNPPDPFTIIEPKDLLTKYWPRDENYTIVAKYLTELEASGKQKLCIWPEHCVINTEGRQIDDVVFEAIGNWEQLKMKKAEYFIKGTNKLTEHYSAIKAEVVYPDAPETGVNWDLVEKVYHSDATLVAGEALSHCVAETLKDLARYLGYDASGITLLEDCTSNVDGFEHLGLAAIEKLGLMGMKIANSKEIVV